MNLLKEAVRDITKYDEKEFLSRLAFYLSLPTRDNEDMLEDRLDISIRVECVQEANELLCRVPLLR